LNYHPLGDPLFVGRPETNLPIPRATGNHPFRWQDWFSCGGCLSLVIAFIVVALFGDDLIHLAMSLFRH
jgi:hypothetical protein